MVGGDMTMPNVLVRMCRYVLIYGSRSSDTNSFRDVRLKITSKSLPRYTCNFNISDISGEYR